MTKSTWDLDPYKTNILSHRVDRGTKNNVLLGLQNWAIEMKPNYWLTFNFNQPYTPDYGEKMLNLWYAQLYRRLEKTSPPYDNRLSRIKLIGGPEPTLGGNLHYHIVARVECKHPLAFQRHALARFRKLVPGGDLYVVPIGEADFDIEEVCSYCFKSTSSERWFVPDYRYLH